MIDRIKDLLPAHYRDYAPRFILFLEKYYEWLYRSSGSMSTSEIAALRSDTSWLSNDIDKFIATGKLRYLDPASLAALDGSIVVLNNTDNPGDAANAITDTFMLDTGYSGYLTSDGLPFTDVNDTSVELNTTENVVLDGWFNSMGLDRIKRSRMTALNNIDQVLMLCLLKHIYAIKGTEASIRLFFALFFDESVTIYQPKHDIAVIDESLVLEGIEVIRDDIIYQEYSYVIVVSRDWIAYKEIFDLIYLNTIHPSGFRVSVIKSVSGVPSPAGLYALVINS
jgi:hypothetical protein